MDALEEFLSIALDSDSSSHNKASIQSHFYTLDGHLQRTSRKNSKNAADPEPQAMTFRRLLSCPCHFHSLLPCLNQEFLQTDHDADFPIKI